MTPEQEDKYNDFKRRFDAARDAGDAEQLKELRQEAVNEITEAGGAKYEQLAQMAGLLDRGITWELLNIIQTAQSMGATHVPISYLKVVAESPKATVAQYWAELTEVDGMIDYGVPDDISELEGL